VRYEGLVPRLRYNNVEITVPPDWIDHSIVHLTSPEEKAIAARASVIITADTSGSESTDLSTYVTAQRDGLQRGAKSYTAIRLEPVEIGGDPGMLLEHAFDSPDRVRVRQLQYYVMKGRVVHTLSITHLEEAFERDREGLLEIARSFLVRSIV
jgi:hypothetical protein